METQVQWLTYHFNIEHMFHVALEQLHHIDDNHDEIDLDDDSTFTDCSIYPNKRKEILKYLFNLTIYLWILLIIWMIFHMWTYSFYF